MSKKEKGKVRKKLSWLLLVTLLILSVLSVNMIGIPPAGASPDPEIYVDPASTVNTGLTPGNNYVVSIKTNYAGNDIWGYEFTLTYNPCILSGTSVTNGDLIVNETMPGGYTGALFFPGTFNNTIGRLSLTTAYFDYFTPPPNMTSGPGTLATVTFTVVGYGESDIKLELDRTKLKGYDDVEDEVYTIIDDITPHPGCIKDGYFRNVDPAPTHDVAVTDVTPSPTTVDAGEIVDIDVTVQNDGEQNETFYVSAYYGTAPNFYPAGKEKLVSWLETGESTIVTIAWNTTYVSNGTYTIQGRASVVPYETDTDDNTLDSAVQVTVLTHDIAVTDLKCNGTYTVYARPGDAVNVSVTIKNEGGYIETDIVVTVWINTTSYAAINKTVVASLAPGQAYIWNISATNITTAYAENVKYRVKANATHVAGEIETIDNTNPGIVMVWVGQYDVDVTSVVTLFKMYTKPPGVVVNQGYKTWTIQINATVHNNGTWRTNCTVEAYYHNGTNWILIGTQIVADLAHCNTATVTFNWTLSDVPICNRAIKVNATDLYVGYGESSTSFKVKGLGDVNNDGTRNVLDVILVFINAGPSPPKNVQCDVNGDCSNNVLDVILVFINAGPYGCV